MDKTWVMATLEQIARYGNQDRGTSRLAFSETDLNARKYFMGLMRETGMHLSTDSFGNITGRIEGRVPSAPAVITGSHLDTVPEGGNYDGVVGVVGGLAAVRRLQTRGGHSHSVELIVFMAEESSRFGFATMGSKVMAGTANLPAWRRAKDRDGISLSAALVAQGLDLEAVQGAVRRKEEMKAYVELHIEQGPVLEREGLSIGIVEAIAAPTRLKITVKGTAGHSGTIPMHHRQDALASAARMVLIVQEAARSQSHRGTVGTVGVLQVHPGGMNVIPGLVEMWVDVRGVDHESVMAAVRHIQDTVQAVGEEEKTPATIQILSSEKPVRMCPSVTEAIERACRTLGVSHRRMPSGAGHDAMNMAGLTAAGMIFIPCRHGISHNPDEYSSPEEILTGIDVLTETLFDLAR